VTTSLDTRGPTPADELAVGRDRISVKLASAETDGEVAVFDVTIPPGGGPPMLHRHDSFELYRIRSGELAIYLEGRDGAVGRTVAGPGAVVQIRGGLEHTIRNESERDAEAVVVFAPGAPMERFARAAADLGPDRSAHEAELMVLAQTHGIEITRSIEDALGETGAEETGSAAAYLTIARFDGDADQLVDAYRQHSAVMSAVGRDHGLILHAGATTDSGFLIVNLWPSKERSEAAASDRRRLGVIERAGISPDLIRREHHEVAHFVVFD
jgi:mannose-6-phosphate isomerase-like protein (cupin superfamily)